MIKNFTLPELTPQITKKILKHGLGRAYLVSQSPYHAINPQLIQLYQLSKLKQKRAKQAKASSVSQSKQARKASLSQRVARVKAAEKPLVLPSPQTRPWPIGEDQGRSQNKKVTPILEAKFTTRVSFLRQKILSEGDNFWDSIDLLEEIEEKLHVTQVNSNSSPNDRFILRGIVLYDLDRAYSKFRKNSNFPYIS
jgi:hypothetical protein